jgi:cytochrome c556
MKRTSLVTAIFLIAAPFALAGDAADQVKYRQTSMSALGKHMKASGMIAKGKVDRKEDMVLHARAMNDLSKTIVPTFGTSPDAGGEETEALPAIWEKPKAFAKAAKALEDATAALLVAAETGDVAQFAEARKKVGPTCGGCHDDFTKEEEE